MRKFLVTLSIITLSSIYSCDIERPASGYSVFFSADCSFHPFNQITSMGQFITVKRKTATSYDVTDAMGSTTTKTLTEIEARNQYHYGIGGLIIGSPSMYPSEIWSFDWACSNCDQARYRLILKRDATGRASCPNCGNVYDLNSGGIIVEGKGRTLWHYRTDLLGGTLYVRN